MNPEELLEEMARAEYYDHNKQEWTKEEMDAMWEEDFRDGVSYKEFCMRNVAAALRVFVERTGLEWADVGQDLDIETTAKVGYLLLALTTNDRGEG